MEAPGSVVGPMDTSPTCWIYRSSRKDEMYLYLRERDNFDPVPDNLRRLFGRPVFVMALDLDPDRRLARVDAAQVAEQLQRAGYFLQLPPSPDSQAH